MSNAKSHGILMSGAMVRAYLAGWKGQTRRTRGLDRINEDPDAWRFNGIMNGFAGFTKPNQPTTLVRLPYGSVGDTLYFKETWKMFEREDDGRDFLHFRADDAKVDPTWWTREDWTGPDPKWNPKNAFHQWQSSMLMPRMCARIHVPITGLRIERLNRITEQDALAEGMKIFDTDMRYYDLTAATRPNIYTMQYFKLWDELNGKKMPVSRNPWLWVYEFEKRSVR